LNARRTGQALNNQHTSGSESVTLMKLTSQAEAIFLSDLQPLDRPAISEITRAIAGSLLTYHGVSGCLAAFATEYGEHPESSANRMRWALSLLTHSTITAAA
jgi:hypothetical protein